MLPCELKEGNEFLYHHEHNKILYAHIKNLIMILQINLLNFIYFNQPFC